MYYNDIKNILENDLERLIELSFYYNVNTEKLLNGSCLRDPKEFLN